MRKQIITFAALILLFILVFSGCANTDRVDASRTNIVATNMVKYSLHGVSDFGFNVNFVTNDKNTTVEFVKFSGENTNGLSVELSDDSYDEIRNLKHKGHYIRLLGFTCKTGDDKVQINSVTLKINGEESNYVFETPIVHHITKDSKTFPVQIKNYPLFVSTNSFDSTEYNFEYHTDSDITITDFSFNDFISIDDARIFINEIDKGSLKNALPLDIPAEASIRIKCHLRLRHSTATEFDSIYCDSQLTYNLDGVTSTLLNNIVCQSVSNEDDAKSVIEILTKNNTTEDIP